MRLFRSTHPPPVPTAIIGAAFLAVALIGLSDREPGDGTMIGACLGAGAALLGMAAWESVLRFLRKQSPKN